jgi:hypothetical protein
MRVRSQRSERKPSLLRGEGERIYFDLIENVLASELRREKVIDPADQRVSAKLPGMTTALQAECFRQVQPVLAGLRR